MTSPLSTLPSSPGALPSAAGAGRAGGNGSRAPNKKLPSPPTQRREQPAVPLCLGPAGGHARQVPARCAITGAPVLSPTRRRLGRGRRSSAAAPASTSTFRPAAPGGISHHDTRDRFQPATVLSVRVRPRCYWIPFIAFCAHHTTPGSGVKARRDVQYGALRRTPRPERDRARRVEKMDDSFRPLNNFAGCFGAAPSMSGIMTL